MKLSTRRSLWAPALVVIGVSIGVAAMLGVTSGLRTWPLWVVFLAAVIVAVAWMDRRLNTPPEAPAPEPESEPEPEKRRPRPTGSGKVYDLEQDRTTDKQRYLM
jgi:hypothetical protein